VLFLWEPYLCRALATARSSSRAPPSLRDRNGAVGKPPRPVPLGASAEPGSTGWSHACVRGGVGKGGARPKSAQPLLTPNLRFVSIFWMRTSLSASDSSASSIKPSPTTLKFPPSEAPSDAMQVPNTIPSTESVTRSVGVSMPLTQSIASVTIGVVALSIWMKPTGKYRCTQLPQASVVASDAPIGSKLYTKNFGVIKFVCSRRTQRQCTSTNDTTVEHSTPRLATVIG